MQHFQSQKNGTSGVSVCLNTHFRSMRLRGKPTVKVEILASKTYCASIIIMIIVIIIIIIVIIIIIITTIIIIRIIICRRLMDAENLLEFSSHYQ